VDLDCKTAILLVLMGYIDGPPNTADALPLPSIGFSRVLTGVTQMSGGFHTVISNNEPRATRVVYVEELPWYIKPWMRRLDIRYGGGGLGRLWIAGNRAFALWLIWFLLHAPQYLLTLLTINPQLTGSDRRYCESTCRYRPTRLSMCTYPSQSRLSGMESTHQTHQEDSISHLPFCTLPTRKRAPTDAASTLASFLSTLQRRTLACHTTSSS
jgi:hypothetical protein